ncbi:VOC family protein [Amycolatopsis sp. NBC_01488]|uniref:VOC family protein n=1 Tax=Amycolatopsis sp. NBC_01488 TaxID=2903563 RepID=UPI002E2B8B24|nr:VOC family protein [Amycolatopsis sp. NBC_01488]
MAITLWAVGYDTADAGNLAGFWSAVLDRPIDDGATAAYAAIPLTEHGPVLSFHQVPEGKTVKNRMHPDLVSTEFDADVRRLGELGATRLGEIRRGDAHWITFADPEGNEFDLIAG